MYRRPDLPPIKIDPYPTPITVAYSHIRALIPKLLFSNGDSKIASPDAKAIGSEPDYLCTIPRSAKDIPNYDIVLNIGMAPGRKFYTLETCAHRDGYNKPDVDGRTLQGDTHWKDTYGAPEILHTGFDTEDVWRRWKSGLMSEDIRPSNNAGHYLCDFTYYASMLEYWRRDSNQMRPCMFLHVPGGYDEEDVIQGREVTLGLIAACVGSEMKRGIEKEGTGSKMPVASDFGDEGLS